MMIMGEARFHNLLGCWILMSSLHLGLCQAQTPKPEFQQPATIQNQPVGAIRGLVRAGDSPIPGVTISVANVTSPSTNISTSTDVDGTYSVPIAAYGTYRVSIQMMAFAEISREVTLDAAHPIVQVNGELTLLSRTRVPSPTPARPTDQRVASRRGFQNLSILQNTNSQDAGAPSNDIVPSGMPVPGMDSTSATESVTVAGNNSSSFDTFNGDERQRFDDGGQQGERFNRGGGAGGRGGFGDRGRPTMFGRRGFDINHPHGSIYYGAGNSALNSAPYSLTGEPATNPEYMQNNFGASVGGPLNVPKLYHGGAKTFFFVNYNGRRGENPFDQFSTVPTLLERQGNFSQTKYTSGPLAGQPVFITDPATNLPFANNTLPQLNPIAQGLLQYIPEPNLPGSVQNFHFVTSAQNSSDDLNLRINHSLGAAPRGPRRGRGGPRNDLAFGFHYHGSNTNLTNPFPSVAGNTNVRSFDVPITYIRSFRKLTNILRFDFNRSRTQTQNIYAFNSDIAANLGITGVSSNPFDWGLPNLSFSNFAGLQDISPQLLRNQTYTFSDYVVWTHGKHSLHWGGDFRRIQLNTETSSNARGSFIFTGINTGYDLADFLYQGQLGSTLAYGLPQQTSVQYGEDNFHFHGNYWDLYLQDEWKVRANLTLNLGVRYDYVSPLTEENNRIANLDLSPGVLNPELGNPMVAIVLPGQTGPFAGAVPSSLLRPDRNNFAPRIGIAWKPFSKTVVRAGYGINYNTGAYQGIAQQLAFQPPFATTATNIQSNAGSLTLAAGFPPPTNDGITNNYSVNPNYRLGYVQIRNVDIQQELRPTLLLNVDYTGTKGTGLDVLEAPNRTATSIRIPDVQAFIFENSVANSAANAGSVRLRKRLVNGFSIGGTYTFSKSIDNASSIGVGATSGSASAGLGGGGTGAGGPARQSSGTVAASGTANVAQNAFDLSAERGLSSFNQTHRFTADYFWELPFGHNKRWLSGNTPFRALFGDWQWSGDWTIASGLPFTPRLLGNFADVNRGSNGTLRPDVVPGQVINIADPSIGEWFNIAAFVTPAEGEFGNARRNSIIGPGTRIFDMAFTKVIPMKESRVLELRAQMTNIFNTPNYSSIDTVVNSPTFGRVISVGTMRQVTMTARFRF
jgi:carboxypeptidase family protein/TonB-dependent receptor-like protein